MKDESWMNFGGGIMITLLALTIFGVGSCFGNVTKCTDVRNTLVAVKQVEAFDALKKMAVCQ